MRAHPTVTASTMITEIQGRHKVRCHTGVVEIFGSERCSHRELASKGAGRQALLILTIG